MYQRILFKLEKRIKRNKVKVLVKILTDKKFSNKQGQS